jgi:hypothetical protein
MTKLCAERWRWSIVLHVILEVGLEDGGALSLLPPQKKAEKLPRAFLKMHIKLYAAGKIF